jgi:hypothetical protein
VGPSGRPAPSCGVVQPAERKCSSRALRWVSDCVQACEGNHAETWSPLADSPWEAVCCLALGDHLRNSHLVVAVPCNTRLPNVSFVSKANPTSENPVSRDSGRNQQGCPHIAGRSEFAEVAEIAGKWTKEPRVSVLCVLSPLPPWQGFTGFCTTPAKQTD